MSTTTRTEHLLHRTNEQVLLHTFHRTVNNMRHNTVTSPYMDTAPSAATPSLLAEIRERDSSTLVSKT
ncbi:hypothetical protein BgiBS90_027026 [Biomphalaria glabrata]|nr:hypothetical protein BgiBS90_027026 [Biomphalaria glabrata]